MVKTVAVDFDGTLCHSPYPAVDAIDTKAVSILQRFQDNGGIVILWTCRSGKELEDAVLACKKHGLIFAAINDNAQINKEKWSLVYKEITGHENPPKASPKVFADLYIDDKNPSGPEWDKIDTMINKRFHFTKHMLFFLFGLLLGLVLNFSVTFASAPAYELVQETYIVQEGDTLDSVALKFIEKNTYGPRELNEFETGIVELNYSTIKQKGIIAGEELIINYWIKTDEN